MAGEDPLGTQFRALRTARGLALADVASATEISVSFLSLFETGKSDITFTRLARLARFFGVSVTDLVPDPDPVDTAVVRREKRRRIPSPGEHAEIDLLSHDTRHQMAPSLLSLEPGGFLSEGTKMEGSELFLFVLRGLIEVGVRGDESVKLRANDSAYYSLDDRPRPALRNVGRGVADVVLVMTPGVRRIVW